MLEFSDVLPLGQDLAAEHVLDNRDGDWNYLPGFFQGIWQGLSDSYEAYSFWFFFHSQLSHTSTDGLMDQRTDNQDASQKTSAHLNFVLSNSL